MKFAILTFFLIVLTSALNPLSVPILKAEDAVDVFPTVAPVSGIIIYSPDLETQPISLTEKLCEFISRKFYTLVAIALLIASIIGALIATTL
jgi:hypothetical protein